ncbi:MAG: hypothetical protein COA96_10410 [SAR86 cluster bacterium]|uniref:DUF1320 domain-containing protein n=1 Tax=SAR86 cluster bacterium TaxID=2030880 RepID=A0A2A5AY09_9GAMM|nr:MAG: hypothetical protein COA96_10410 [SAR86 cluster bacterium]
MSSGTEIIKDALKEIGAHSVASPAAPESIEDGLKKLNSMLEMWLTKGIMIGVSQLDKHGANLNEPTDCRDAIVTNLAISCAPLFDNGKVIVSQDLRINARVGFNNVESLYRRVEIPKKVLSSTTPVGAGNNRNGRFNRTFWRRGSEVEN